MTVPPLLRTDMVGHSGVHTYVFSAEAFIYWSTHESTDLALVNSEVIIERLMGVLWILIGLSDRPYLVLDGCLR
jgi:hypothetical protein